MDRVRSFGCSPWPGLKASGINCPQSSRRRQTGVIASSADSPDCNDALTEKRAEYAIEEILPSRMADRNQL
ncbi:uncharacterized protein ColSpa_10838 [Colletotrichum spaethianum]|uniref:Uncharacterized protein n=1 Tax=Colletotrichum spaethianum TaxID=700344 RepID=A0AA37URF8_9PEZI|nr:uncharacterized protein ColSpa_10838 [Colletotrichum spaethianum]GKT50657.1 hypothetical protein ColSpa_10838 [Colletotrichum spaethianum]